MGDFTEKNGTWPTWKCGNPSSRKTVKKTGSLTFWSSLTWKKSKPNQTMLSAATRPRPWKCGAKIWQSPTVQMGTSGLYHRKMVEFWAEKNWASPANTGRNRWFSRCTDEDVTWNKNKLLPCEQVWSIMSRSVLNCWITLTMLKPERSKVYAGYTSRRRTNRLENNPTCPGPLI